MMRAFWRKHRKFLRDAAERVLWTAVQAGLPAAVVIVEDLPPAWIAVAAPVLAAVKALAARKVGDKDSASTLPALPPAG